MGELDMQCNWSELRSVQCSEGLFMLEDIIRCQKLEAEITEGEQEVKKFKRQSSEINDKKSEVPDTPGNELDLTPSLSGTQTLSLTGGGEWKSEGVSDNVPLPDNGTEELPP